MREVEVEVAKRDVMFFGKNRTFPVMVQINDDKVHIGDHVFRIYKAPDNGFHAARGTSVLGTFNAHAVLKSVSEVARKDLKALRAALFGVEYDVPLAFEVRHGGVKHYVHPGACYKSHVSEGQRTRPLHAVKGDKRCHVCSEGFE